MTLSIELDDELDNWLDRMSEQDGVTKEELVESLVWEAYEKATKDI